MHNKTRNMETYTQFSYCVAENKNGGQQIRKANTCKTGKILQKHMIGIYNNNVSMMEIHTNFYSMTKLIKGF